jgi:hypothetical protein
MSKLLKAAPLIVVVPLLAACASASAKSAGGPDLVVPPPPPHVIPINAEPVIEPVADVPAPPSPGARPPARPPAPKPAAGDSKPAPKAGEAKPETPPVEPPPAAPAPPPAPAPQLRTTESSGAEAAVRVSLERTKQLLSGVDYRKLNAVRRKAYDDANRFSQQAEDALKTGNVVFAQGVATKAETLARELANK